jgi:hypothetical protein
MDVEGSEYSILESITELNVDQITMEWHHWLQGQRPHGGFMVNPYSLEDTKKMIKKIVSFGYVEYRSKVKEEYRVIEHSVFVRKDLV